jgi:hypothetical protein
MTDEFYLHPLLRYSQHNVTTGHCCPILWDLREPPETARRVVALESTISDFYLTRPATSPPMVVLHITCDIFPGDWPIEVRSLDGVTVGDVLRAIHSTLMRPIRRFEWDGLSEKQQKRTEAVFEERCNQTTNRVECHSQGVLRMDCILQHIWFAGLTVSPETDCSCILTLRRPQQLPQ